MTPMQQAQAEFSKFLVAWMTDKGNMSPSPVEIQNLGMAFFGGVLIGANFGRSAEADALVEASHKLACDFATVEDVVRVELLLKGPDLSGN